MKASFIDLGGNTARVDPQTTPTAYIRLQIFWQAVYDDSSGAEVNSPRAGEIYMTVEQAGVLAEALKNARMTNNHPRTTTEADTLRAAQAAPAAVAGPSDRIPIEDSIAWQETGTGVERNAVMVSGRTWYRDDHPLLAPTTQAAPKPAAQRERMFRNRPSNVGKGISLADWHRVVQYVEACHGIEPKEQSNDCQQTVSAASASDSRYRTGCNRRGDEEEETVNTYTVILLYPDYIASNYGEDYYFWKGEAESPTDAARKAQQFLASEHNSDDATSEPEDFYVVAVIEGRPSMFFPE